LILLDCLLNLRVNVLSKKLAAIDLPPCGGDVTK